MAEDVVMSWWVGVSRQDWPAVVLAQQERLHALKDSDVTARSMSRSRPTRQQKRAAHDAEEV